MELAGTAQEHNVRRLLCRPALACGPEVGTATHSSHAWRTLHSGHGRRLVPEPAVHAEIPQTDNAASACFEG